MRKRTDNGQTHHHMRLSIPTHVVFITPLTPTPCLIFFLSIIPVDYIFHLNQLALLPVKVKVWFCSLSLTSVKLRLTI